MRIFLKTEIFFSVLTLRLTLHVNGVFGNHKTELFENAVFVFTCRRAKTNVFLNDNVIIG